MKPVHQLFLFVVHKDVLIVKRQDDKIQETIVKSTFSQHN